ncbi:MAG: toll/interleukin-1 receptor domain-containing protein [Acidobacteriota bacterium]
MAGVFISYRRGDGGWAGRLKDHVQLRFGDSLVWQDVDDIKYGKDFSEAIQKAIKTSNAALVVIGPYWQEAGLKRMKDPKDVLRMEIGLALKSRAVVIPVLVGGADMPQAKALPTSIAGLVKLDAAFIHDTDWARGVQILIDQLQQIVRATGTTEPLTDLQSSLAEMESRYFKLIVGEADRALAVAQQALRLLDDQMPRYPQDVYLQLVRGYFLKNEAMAQRDVGNSDGFKKSLDNSDRVFKTMLDESKMHLASAYNGMGSVELLREHFSEAVGWIDRALELIPNYEAALHDRQTAVQYLKQAKQ